MWWNRFDGFPNLANIVQYRIICWDNKFSSLLNASGSVVRNTRSSPWIGVYSLPIPKSFATILFLLLGQIIIIIIIRSNNKSNLHNDRAIKAYDICSFEFYAYFYNCNYTNDWVVGRLGQIKIVNIIGMLTHQFNCLLVSG